MNDERYYTVKEVTEMAGISRTTLNVDIERGLIKPFHFGRNVRFKSSEVDEYIKQKQQSKWVSLHCGKKNITAQEI